MKSSMIDYMGTMTNRSFRKTLNLLENKFKKFRTLFHMFSEYSADISDIILNESDESTLDCSIIFVNSKAAQKAYKHIPTPYLYDTQDYTIDVEKSVVNIVLSESETIPSSDSD